MRNTTADESHYVESDYDSARLTGWPLIAAWLIAMLGPWGLMYALFVFGSWLLS